MTSLLMMMMIMEFLFHTLRYKNLSVFPFLGVKVQDIEDEVLLGVGYDGTNEPKYLIRKKSLKEQIY